uniref:Uncharacterized protein n=1 Tax=Solanum demissum TaxID=50514 RepID=Q0KIR9_SOLDE|nr:hypothetical protein SDM1_47t00004 [Solanum demissum]
MHITRQRITQPASFSKPTKLGQHGHNGPSLPIKICTTKSNKPPNTGSSEGKGLANRIEVNPVAEEVYSVVCQDLHA